MGTDPRLLLEQQKRSSRNVHGKSSPTLYYNNNNNDDNNNGQVISDAADADFISAIRLVIQIRQFFSNQEHKFIDKRNIKLFFNVN